MPRPKWTSLKEVVEMMWKALGLAAAVAAIAIPSAGGAQSWTGAAFTAGPAFAPDSSGVTVHRGSSSVNGGFAGGDRRFRHGEGSGRHDRSRNRGGDDLFLGGWGYYDPDVNRSWDSDSYNDWWHDRPDRAYPRWVQHNQPCEPDRMWWGGGVWRCDW
jgi:hypothetical protein